MIKNAIKSCREFLFGVPAPSEFSFDEYQRANHARGFDIYTSALNWTPMEWGCALAGETGELCNWLKKWQRDGGSEELRAEIGKEIGDIISYADKIASYYGLRTGAITANKFNEVSRRLHVEDEHVVNEGITLDPETYALGNYDHLGYHIVAKATW